MKIALVACVAAVAMAWVSPAAAQDPGCIAKVQRIFQNRLPPLTACSIEASAGSVRGVSAGRKVYYAVRIAGAGFKGLVQLSTDGFYDPVPLADFAERACNCGIAGGSEVPPLASGLLKFAPLNQPPVLVAIDRSHPSRATWRFGVAGDEALVTQLWSAFSKDRRVWTDALR